MKLILTCILTCFILALTSFTSLAANDSYAPSAGYHNYKELTQALKELSTRYSKITRLSSIGTTGQGRDIWMLQLSGEKGMAPEQKQALLLCGNLEGDHVIGSEVALGIAKTLAAGYGSDQEITAILDSRTFYIIPRVNPDGAEMFFAGTLSDVQGNIKQVDDDYDWQLDEDGPEDLDGNKLITWMRVKDKKGAWVLNGKDSRLLNPKKPETPMDSLYSVYPEGIDNDGDELYNEDGIAGMSINRNFPHNFGYDIKGLNIYPASEAETRAVIDFMNRYIPELKTSPHKNICSVLIFSKYDNLAASAGIECGKASFAEVKRSDEQESQMFVRFGRRRGSEQETSRPRAQDPQPQKTDDKDLPLFNQVSKKYKELTKIETAVSDKPFGSMLEWAYFQYGVPAFSCNLWSLRNEKNDKPEPKGSDGENSDAEQQRPSGRRGGMRTFPGARPAGAEGEKADASGTDQRWLKWVDEKNNGIGFLPWKTFQHQQLGDVEIGGFYPYIRTNAPSALIDSLCQSHTKFALYLASQFAEIKMDAPQTRKLSTNLYEVKVTLRNTGKFPYATEMGQKSRNLYPIVTRLKFENEKDMKLFGGQKRYDLNNLEAGAEKEYTWIIISPPGQKVDIALWARQGGGEFQTTVKLP
ncbi:MAG: M14 family metallopeptidase [Candidatus Zhuqueibacterota bacterium]